MEADSKAKIEGVMEAMRCPDNFKCVKGDAEQLCKAEDYGNANYVKCLEKKASRCVFSIPFGVGGYCKCPLRVYLCKELQK